MPYWRLIILVWFLIGKTHSLIFFDQISYYLDICILGFVFVFKWRDLSLTYIEMYCIHVQYPSIEWILHCHCIYAAETRCLRCCRSAYLLLMTGPTFIFTQLTLRIWTPTAQEWLPLEKLVPLRSMEASSIQGPQGEASQKNTIQGWSLQTLHSSRAGAAGHSFPPGNQNSQKQHSWASKTSASQTKYHYYAVYVIYRKI